MEFRPVRLLLWILGHIALTCLLVLAAFLLGFALIDVFQTAILEAGYHL